MITAEAQPATGELLVRLKGDVLSTNAALLGRDFAAALGRDGGAGTVTLDLFSARMVDSTGLNALFGMARLTKEKGRPFKFVVRHPAVQRVFAVARLDTLAPVEVRTRKKRAPAAPDGE